MVKNEKWKKAESATYVGTQKSPIYFFPVFSLQGSYFFFYFYFASRFYWFLLLLLLGPLPPLSIISLSLLVFLISDFILLFLFCICSHFLLFDSFCSPDFFPLFMFPEPLLGAFLSTIVYMATAFPFPFYRVPHKNVPLSQNTFFYTDVNLEYLMNFGVKQRSIILFNNCNY